MMYDTEDARRDSDLIEGSQNEYKDRTNSDHLELTNLIEETKKDVKRVKSPAKKRPKKQNTGKILNVVIQTSKSSNRKSDRRHLKGSASFKAKNNKN